MTVDLGLPEVRNVSNSEVTAFLSCKRQYNYAHILDLAPKVTSDPLARGTTGHLAFQRYVEARLNGSNHEQSMKAGLVAFEEMLREGVALNVVMETQFLWVRYMEFHQGWPQWKLLGTEQRVDLPITDTLNFPIRYDLYFEDIPTEKRGLLDYKFTYDFWTPDDHDLNGQMPKYIAVMNMNGFRVDFGVLEEIRTRKLGAEKSADQKNLWRSTVYNPPRPKLRAMMQQHVAAALEIEKHRALSPEEREIVSIPVLNKHGACKFCNFKSLCISTNEGKKDLTVDIRTDFTENTYGYNKQVIEELL